MRGIEKNPVKTEENVTARSRTRTRFLFPVAVGGLFLS